MEDITIEAWLAIETARLHAFVAYWHNSRAGLNPIAPHPGDFAVSMSQEDWDDSYTLWLSGWLE